MTWNWPIWLILIVPFLGALWFAGIPRRMLSWSRVLILLLLWQALCGLSLTFPSRHGCVVVVADRSLSMPSGSQALQEEVADLLFRSMRGDDELAVVSFGEKTAVEHPPQRARFAGFTHQVGSDGSNLADALDRAVSLIPAGRPGRILVLSDGQATGRNVSEAAGRAASAGIAIDYRSLQRPAGGDLAISRIEAPPSVAAGEAFMVSAWVVSPRAQQISYEFRCGDDVLATGEREVPEGRSRLLFRDRAREGGARSYRLNVRSAEPEDDPVPENNRARFLVGVRGIKPLLCVGPAESSLPDLLSAGGLRVERRKPDQFRWTLAELAGYTAVLVENTPASRIGTGGMETLSTWISEAGGGLLLTGGRNAYGAGGYFKSALEPVLPVSMELRREHRKLSLAIVVVLDRSGSMAVQVPGGRTKMELANLATCEVLNQLSGADQFGCLAVDSMAHEIVPLSDLSSKSDIERRVLTIDSMGGGIFVYEALKKAVSMIAPATAGTRHIVLFSDAADSEQPGDYQELVGKCVDAGVTISVIGLGHEGDVDAELLKDIARRGGGQCFFTEDPHELPRLFTQDTFLVSRSTFVEAQTPVQATAGMTALTSLDWRELPSIGGYNLCYLRPGANLGVITRDEYQAPLVAGWQAGIGRVLCYTGEADGNDSGAIASWPRVGEFFTTLARWVGDQDQGLGSEMLLTQQQEQGRCLVQLHLDSERTSTPFSELPQLTVLRGDDGDKPITERVTLNWTSADVLSAELPLNGVQTLLTTLAIPGVGQTTLPPICLPYSPEFEVQNSGEGTRTLERLASGTGGTERIRLDGIWNELPRKPRLVSVAPWLLSAAIILFLLDILQRRTGILTLQWKAKPIRSALERKKTSRPITSRPARASVPPPATVTPSAESTATELPEVPERPAIDALSQARERAARRTQR